MKHLNRVTLLEIVEGTRSAQSVLHLTECEGCRAKLAGLQAAWQAAADVNVPEPSPLFWDHLSARVREAVAAEEA
jgi:hypothetical protein